MKPTIKQLLDELLNLTPPAQRTLLSNAYEKMETGEAVDVVSSLLFWQKGLINKQMPPSNNRKKDKLILDYQPVVERFVAFFEHCPALEEVFLLQEKEVHYNPALSKAEQQEIQLYIDNHHSLPLHIRGIGTLDV